MLGVISPVYFIPEDWDVVERKLQKIQVMLEQPLQAEIIEAGIMIVNTVKILISVAYPPSSSPFNPPHMRTGQLQESYDILEIGDYFVDVGSDLGYAFSLEFGNGKMLPRPHFFGTAMEVIKDFPRLFLTKVTDEVGRTG